MRVPATLTFQGGVPVGFGPRNSLPVAMSLSAGFPSRLYIDGHDVGEVQGWPLVEGYAIRAVDEHAPGAFITERTIINVVLDLPCPSSASPGGLSAITGGQRSRSRSRRGSAGATGALADDE